MFIEGQNGESICIICNETVSEKKSGKLERYFTVKHKDFNVKYPLDSHGRSQKFEQLQKNFKFQQNIFVKRIKLAEAETYASNAVNKYFPLMHPLKTFKYKLGYPTDITAKFSELNLRLQGNGPWFVI